MARLEAGDGKRFEAAAARGPEDLQGRTRWLRRIAFDLTRDDDQADDLVQDTLVALLRRPANIEPVGDGWLRTVLRNLHIDRVRSRLRRGLDPLSADTEDESTPHPDMNVHAARMVAALDHEVEALSEPFRTTLRLSYWEDLSSADVAIRLGVPAATVRRRNQLALAQLRKRLKKLDDGPAVAKRTEKRRAGSAIGLFFPGLARRTERASVPSSAHWHLGWLGLALGTASVVLLATAHKVSFTGVQAHASSTPAEIARAPIAPARAWRFPEGVQSASSRDRLPDEPLPLALDPTGQPRCPSLQSLIDHAAPGTAVDVPACVYRETAVVTKPLVLDAQPGAEIRGSDVWTSFYQRGAAWESAEHLPEFPAKDSGNCESVTHGPCRGLSQVFRDGHPLTRVGLLTSLGPDDFAVTPERTVLLGADPEGHTIEVTTRGRWLRVRSSDVVIRGFRMRHAASHDDCGALDVDRPWERLIVERNILSHTAGAIIAVSGVSQSVVDNEISYAGGPGLVLRAPSLARVTGNRIHHNGLLPAKRTGWRDGGIKAFAASATIIGNEVYENFGSGFMCAYCQDTVIEGNLLRDNAGAAIRYFVSQRSTIDHNQIERNGWAAAPVEPAVFLTQSNFIDVRANVVREHHDGFIVMPSTVPVPPRPDVVPCRNPSGNAFAGNVFISSGRDDGGLRFVDDPLAPRPAFCPKNIVVNNRQWERPVRDAKSSWRPTLRIPGLLPMTDADKDAVLRLSHLSAAL